MNHYLEAFTDCPCCGFPAESAYSLFKTLQYGKRCSVLRCQHCSLIFKELAPTDSGLGKIYTSEYIHFNTGSHAPELPEVYSVEIKLARCQKLLKNRPQPKDLRLLDIGCGAGQFVKIARHLGYFAEGIDPYLPNSIQNSYLYKKTPDCMQKNSYDIIVALHVAEHLTNPRQFFNMVKQLLKSDGVLLLTCPYGDSLARRIYQSRWFHVALDEHILFWNPYSLTTLLRNIGFKGKVSYRIMGVPFPFGRAELELVSNPTLGNKLQTEILNDNQTGLGTINIKNNISNSFIWEISNKVQANQRLANIIRSIINLTRIGDYLEYAISIGK